MILIRVIVGLTFVIEGSLKFLRPEELGAGRFAAIGLPFAHPLSLVVIATALVTTKIPILLGRPLGPFALAKLNHYGWLSFFHEARVDLCMAFGLAAVAIDSGLRLGRKRRWYQSGG